MYLPSSHSARILFILSAMMIILSGALFLFNKSILLEWDLTFMPATNLLFYTILDPHGTLLSSIVMFISANIMNFASFYMMEELYLNRFIHLVMLFVASMNFLIFFPHFMGLLLGWDGLGLTSFLLVIYYQSPKSLGAGMITALTNRIGDVLLLISIALTLNQSHWNILEMWNSSWDWTLSILLLFAAMTKSAQVPFSSWLPAAMAAPTPVSALVHSSTLVTAGVFLLYRFYPFLSNQKSFFFLLMIISCFTMIMAGISALSETDLKKIIALSTLSQLGVMMSSLALGLPQLALFHLMSHALFKALLFVCAGSLIHMNSHYQDLRLAGNILSQMPSIASSFIISNIALCGLPFLAAFYSKDMILEMSMFNNQNWIISLMFSTATLLTAFYTARFLFLGWSPLPAHNPIHSISDIYMNSFLPASFLTIGAIAGGSSMNWFFFAPNQEPFISSLEKMSPLISTMIGLFLGVWSSNLSSSSSLFMRISVLSSTSMWFLTPISTQMMIKYPLLISSLITKHLDQGWNELAGGQGSFMFLKTNFPPLVLSQYNISTIHLTSAIIILTPSFFL